MPEAGHLVLPVMLALLSAGAMAYYQPREVQDSITGPDTQQPYLLHEVVDHEYPDQGGWEPAPDPRFYLLTEQRQYDTDQASPRRVKRNNGPSLSIVNSLDVLRQRLLLEIARRRMRQSEDQILANRELLKSIGKRDVHQSQQRSGSDVDRSGNTRSSHGTSMDWPALSRNQREKL